MTVAEPIDWDDEELEAMRAERDDREAQQDAARTVDGVGHRHLGKAVTLGHFVGGVGVATRTTCRSGCGRVVEVTEAAEEVRATMNRELARRRAAGGLLEPDTDPIDARECHFCDACRLLFEAKKRQHADDVSRKVNDACRRLRDDPAPRSENPTYDERDHIRREIDDVAYVRKYADEGGKLVDAIMARRSGARGSRKESY